jgi:hypothetical protein
LESLWLDEVTFSSAEDSGAVFGANVTNANVTVAAVRNAVGPFYSQVEEYLARLTSDPAIASLVWIGVVLLGEWS